jgi:hypothetical protein
LNFDEIFLPILVFSTFDLEKFPEDRFSRYKEVDVYEFGEGLDSLQIRRQTKVGGFCSKWRNS